MVTNAMMAPQFPPQQHVAGIISLPYGELNEPFESWLDGS
jgi:hypothetical protein